MHRPPTDVHDHGEFRTSSIYYVDAQSDLTGPVHHAHGFATADQHGLVSNTPAIEIPKGPGLICLGSVLKLLNKFEDIVLIDIVQPLRPPAYLLGLGRHPKVLPILKYLDGVASGHGKSELISGHHIDHVPGEVIPFSKPNPPSPRGETVGRLAYPLGEEALWLHSDG